MIENVQSIYNADRISKLVDFISFRLHYLKESITKKSRDKQDNDFNYLNDDTKDKIIESIYRAKVGNKKIEIGVCGEHTNYLENLDFLNSIEVSCISATASMIPLLKANLSKIERDFTLKKLLFFILKGTIGKSVRTIRTLNRKPVKSLFYGNINMPGKLT
ncbi:MAG: hypothetical protein HFJ12_07425 [Bacilli bacterium]|nr:hypothetical protein [Bacilli bacterium]